MNTKSDSELINDMADAMLSAGENCTRDQLLLRFTSAEIDQLAEKARARAREMQTRQTRARVPATRAA